MTKNGACLCLGLYDIEAALILEMSAMTITRGSERKLNKVPCRTELRRHFFTQRITDTWNSLPTDIRNSGTLNVFKNALDRFWRNQAVYFDSTINQKLLEPETVAGKIK